MRSSASPNRRNHCDLTYKDLVTSVWDTGHMLCGGDTDILEWFRHLDKAAIILPTKPLEEQLTNRWKLCSHISRRNQSHHTNDPFMHHFRFLRRRSAYDESLRGPFWSRCHDGTGDVLNLGLYIVVALFYRFRTSELEDEDVTNFDSIIGLF
ncbi:hypothetical protein HYC85_000825 [Camellia sinensis]|uniref:Uncharacterized protein n=1 Tax=Camellia sinensis TaxID=4442 RepID=A0A7J7I540_CAMSI|nr:hypothetical protein HYC85_000825 [Camellia sinensis]